MAPEGNPTEIGGLDTKVQAAPILSSRAAGAS